MLRVLRTKDLVHTIAIFQDGLHPDVLPPTRLLRRVRLRRGSYERQFAAVHDCLEPWLARHGTSSLGLFPASLHRHLFYYAVVYGNLDVLVFLDAAAPVRLSAADWALVVDVGLLDVLGFFLDRHYDGGDEHLMAHAIETGALAAVQCIFAHGILPAKDALNEACTNGHADVVRFLHGHGLGAWDPNTLMFVLVHGHLEVLRFLLDAGLGDFDASAAFGFHVSHLEMAAKCGHLDVVQYLAARDRRHVPQAFLEAARSGHAAIVQFLNDGESVDVPAAAKEAVVHGHSDVVAFLVQAHGAALDLHALATLAASRKRRAVHALLLQHAPEATL
ncbi:hypothetical protein SDRG_16803 [Saprolegnia diclina VS20]|uniref:Uncharacterized protein n=1 Tax=Saprolegnia diclina (strain VS20) TaxID=1156394 RepID=T0PWC2_SAPDV|nr:hypothetical protein SDRG_16803 [Saprolegnia diclina VS20]EQC25340.1 hypothetical protein SDRG_16803 [Saprolegnia diclina VS20]|eukprot:XP_008621245.1 hypothetical protein SDRG_16803 [Saprolegnia diclina VS20]